MNQLDYETYEKKLHELNGRKRALELRVNISDPKRYAEDFRLLANEYAAIAARANHAYCMNRYQHYSETAAPESAPADNGAEMLERIFAEAAEEVRDETIYYWQSRADMGDD